MVYLEGSADIMASRISGHYIEIIDKKIPYASIKDYHSFINYKHSPDHIYQARYYMRNIKSIKIKNNNIERNFPTVHSILFTMHIQITMSCYKNHTKHRVLIDSMFFCVKLI